MKIVQGVFKTFQKRISPEKIYKTQSNERQNCDLRTCVSRGVGGGVAGTAALCTK